MSSKRHRGTACRPYAFTEHGALQASDVLKGEHAIKMSVFMIRAFSTLFGPANLSWFQVWTCQSDPAVVDFGDPTDLAKRLDGTPTLRFPPGVG